MPFTKTPLPRRNPNSAGATPPEAFAEMARRFPDAAPALRNAVNQAAEAYRGIHSSAQQAMNDQTLTPAARTLRAARAAGKRLDQLTEALGTSRAQARQQLAALNERLAEPFSFERRSAAALTVASELRAYLRSLPTQDRLTAVSDAINNSDLTVLEALGAAPAVLSGVPQAVWTRARDVVSEIFHPGIREVRDSVAEAVKLSETLENGITQGAADMIDFSSAEALAAGAEAA